MAASSIDRTEAALIRIRGTDGVGKSAFVSTIRALPLPTATGRDNPTVSPSPDNIEETH